ncbi:restriction endonuclease subunit S [Enterococcus faecalis]|uniref:restriction endonuclease subunit S n=1 Tax=Enterococcus faecalis TaxID=1351 RepID=UPI0009AC8A71|nr:restriction endonuclease subunit S [Enterococcus faecalis]EGO9143069.1 restriction endonuclease subunit S [Enterococcus faecalis]EHV2912963.1 restriction endonuclease subunit S [Enterococcus faecalis]EKI7402392.1 restriction endonuclease subunit S [Enterococcus faecalis]EKR9284499.1 restriction endonuclease subunit S [Enterococcus faecalis]EKZ0442635.1 restriction endonuclease subunit S [Enterococcus faecalis]
MVLHYYYLNLLIVFTLIGVWELCKLEEIVDVRSGRDYKHLGSGNIPVYGTGGYMLSVSEALSYDEDAIGIGRKGTINNPYILKAPFWTVDTLFYTVPKNNFDLNFIYSIFRKINWKSKDESTGVPSLSKTTINAVTVYIPSGSEQQRIGKFFKQLDDTITLHQRKLDQLKELKKAYLQLMFPKKDERVPKLRFADFEDDWQLCKLGEVFNLENGFAFQSEYFTMKRTKSIVLTPGNVEIGGGFKNGKGRYYSSKGKIPKKFIFEPDDIFITMTDLTPSAQSLGYPARIPNDEYQYLHNQRLGKITNFQCDCKFIFQLLCTERYHKYIVSTASGTTVKHSSVKKILNYKSSIPLKKEEQRIIGIFFESLDENINTNQNKLAILKDLKKSYLQNMFI